MNVPAPLAISPHGGVAPSRMSISYRKGLRRMVFSRLFVAERRLIEPCPLGLRLNPGSAS